MMDRPNRRDKTLRHNDSEAFDCDAPHSASHPCDSSAALALRALRARQQFVHDLTQAISKAFYWPNAGWTLVTLCEVAMLFYVVLAMWLQALKLQMDVS